MNTPPSPAAFVFARWCVLTHARPVLVTALRAWGFAQEACALEKAASTGALRPLTLDALQAVRRTRRFQPARRDLMGALSALNASATFAGRGDSENAAAMAVGVVVGARSALAWRRPWQHFRWRERRAAIIHAARQEQISHKDSGIFFSDLV